MSRKGRLIYVIGVLGLGFALVRPAAAQSLLRLEFTVTRNTMQTSTQPSITTLKRTEYIAPNGDTRTETTDPRTGQILSVEIQDKQEDLLIELDPAKKMANQYVGVQQKVRSGQPVLGSSSSPVAAQKQDLGIVIIDGFTCHHYRDWVGPSSVEFSVCHDPTSNEDFFGEIIGSGPMMKLPNGWAYSGEWHQTLVKVTRSVPLDASLFEVPPNYKLVQK